MEKTNEIPAVLLLSHGPLCDGLLESTKMIYGNVTRVETLGLAEGMDPGEYEVELRKLVGKYEGNIFFLVDIMGGTPFNTMAKLVREKQYYGMAGMNMPMLIEVLANREECSGAELAKQVTENITAIGPDLTNFLQKIHNK